MVDPLDRVTFETLIGELGVPNERVVYATRPERRAYLVTHRRRLLTATPEGRTRLRQWLEADVSLPALSHTELANFVRYRVTLFGDLAHLAIIVRGLLTLPECMRHFLLNHCAFIGVGLDSRAWCSSAALVDCDGPKSRLIALGPDVDEHVIRHEGFHAWHSPLPRPANASPAVTAVGEAQLYQLASTQGWATRIDQHRRFEERLAEGGAIAWS